MPNAHDFDYYHHLFQTLFERQNKRVLSGRLCEEIKMPGGSGDLSLLQVANSRVQSVLFEAQ